MIVTTEAIVLRSRKQGDTSKITTLYTEQFGKVDVIAKGARELKSKFGGALEMFAHINAVFYKKDKPGLYLLSKSDTIHSNAKILNSLEKIEVATAIIELIIKAMHDEEENNEVYKLLTGTLLALAHSESEEAASSFLIYFYLNFAHIMGYRLQLHEADSEREQGELNFEATTNRHFETRTVFHVRSGELVEHIVHHRQGTPIGLDEVTFEGLPVTPEAREALFYLENANLEKASRLRLSERAKANLTEIFRAYFAEHIPGINQKALKSSRVFSGLS